MNKQFEEGKDMYAVMHVTGFIRSWPPAGYGADAPPEALDDVNLAQGANSGNYCLVGVARLQVIIFALCGFFSFQPTYIYFS